MAYKFGCVSSVSCRPQSIFALLKRGCANSGGFGSSLSGYGSTKSEFNLE